MSWDDQREGLLTAVITHQADPPYPGLGHGTLAHLGGLLPEEEVEFVIILFSAVWDEVRVDKRGICEEGVGVGGWVALASVAFHVAFTSRYMCFYFDRFY